MNVDLPSIQSQPAGWLLRRVRDAAGWSLLFQLTSKGALFGASAALAHSLSVNQLGELTSLQGAVFTVAAISDIGVSLWIEREGARGYLSVSDVRNIASSRIGSSILLGMAGAVGLSMGVASPEISTPLAAAGSALLCSAVTNATLQAGLRYRASALSQTLCRVLYFLLVITICLTTSVSLVTALWAFAAAEMALAASQFILIKGDLRRCFSFRYSVSRQVLSKTIPYWVSAAAFIAYNRADVTLVRIFAGAKWAGLYAPASLMQNALMLVPGAAVAALPTAGARAWGDSADERRSFINLMRRITFVSLDASILASSIACIIAPTLVRLYAGSRYMGAVGPVRILVWSIPFNAVELTLLGTLVAMGRPRRTVWFYLTALLASVASIALLAPRWGPSGGALASLIREPVALLVLAFVVSRSMREDRI